MSAHLTHAAYTRRQSVDIHFVHDNVRVLITIAKSNLIIFLLFRLL
jgi:hypothetical protein